MVDLSDSESLRAQVEANIVTETIQPNKAKTNSPSPIEIVHMRDLRVNTDDSNFVIPGHLRRGQLGFVTGGYASGKTALTLHLCYQVATGGKLFGLTVKPCPVLYVPLEDKQGVEDRLCYIREMSGAADIYVCHPANVDGNYDPSLIMKSNWMDAFCKQATNKRVGLIVFDTRDDIVIAAGADTNKTEEMGRIIKRLEEIGRTANCAVMVLTHPSKGAKSNGEEGAISGSENQGNAAYLLLHIERDSKNDTWILKVHKNKNGRDGAKYNFRVEVGEVGKTDINGWPITAPFVSEMRVLSPAKTHNLKLTDTQRAWWDVILDAIKKRGSHGKVLGENSPSASCKKMARKAFNEVVIDAGLLGERASFYSENGTLTGTRRPMNPSERRAIQNKLISLKGKGLLNFNSDEVWLVRE